MIPEIQVSIIDSQNGQISTAFNNHYLRTANLSTPDSFVWIDIHNPQLSFACPKNKVVVIVISQKITGSYFWDFILIFWLNEEVIIFKFLIFSIRPKMDLVSANSCKL